MMGDAECPLRVQLQTKFITPPYVRVAAAAL